MQKWEYLIEHVDRYLFHEELQPFGDEGWELLFILRPDPTKAVYLYHFKRPKG